MRPRHFVVYLAAALILSTAIGAAPVSAAASPTACVVKNIDTGITTRHLQLAINAARAGQRLRVKGTCHGLTWINKALTVRGARTRTSGAPTLDGDYQGWVVSVSAPVTIIGLTIQHGSAPYGRCNVKAGGIHVWSTLILRNVVVQRNQARSRDYSDVCGGDGIAGIGGGIDVDGSLTLEGSTVVRSNTDVVSAGVYLESGSLTMNDSSSITNNNGPGVYVQSGSLTMNGSSAISKNAAAGFVAAVTIHEGTMIMNDSSTVADNVVASEAAVYLSSASELIMNGSSSIRNNQAGRGGVDSQGWIAMHDASTIMGNKGGGIENHGSVFMHGTSSIADNDGGGVTSYATADYPSSFQMFDASSIRGNTSGGQGGGINLWGGELAMNDSSSIYDNTADDGGGVYSYYQFSDTFYGVSCGVNVHDNTPNDCVSDGVRFIKPFHRTRVSARNGATAAPSSRTLSPHAKACGAVLVRRGCSTPTRAH